MKHSIQELADIVRLYYPSGLSPADASYEVSAEHRRLVDARRQGAMHSALWQGLLERLQKHFPGAVILNDSLHLATGQMDAGYSGKVFCSLSEAHAVGFSVSLLAPYYALYSSRFEPCETVPSTTRVLFVGHVAIALPVWLDRLLPRWISEPSTVEPARRQILRHEISPEEAPYANWLAREIEATWGYERMPPEVGNVPVPEVATNARGLGEATLYDCLFSDSW